MQMKWRVLASVLLFEYEDVVLWKKFKPKDKRTKKARVLSVNTIFTDIGS